MLENKISIKCPSCKSIDTKLVQKRDNNNVCGPGYYSWIVDEYYSCNKCGVRFDKK